jgi:hypothetical protein
MRTPAPDTGPRFGSIIDGETLPLREAARRMGWAKRLSIDVQRMGLKTVTIGRLKYTTGRWVREFVESQAEQQTGDVDGGPDRAD